MRTDKFEKEIKDAILFERESVEKYYIKTAHLLRKYDIPDRDIIMLLWGLYTKATNDVIRYVK